jgi:hypothetical protein
LQLTGGQKALNLYNAALVTPTYYVFFTSATIISDAVLYRGFKGSPLQIVTVVLGFLQICSGVVLLQLSKSAKDVPDSAVFTGDLDQMRTVAEQEEPEYEPRADTMRGTAALLRAVSTSRQKRETQEVIKLREEHLQPIGENEQVEWDGLRRRRTLSSPGQRPLSRRKTVHPPLGMSHIPDDDDDATHHDPDNGMHPGFWSHFKRKPVTTPTDSSVAMGPMPSTPNTYDGTATTSPHRPPSSNPSSHIFGLPIPLRRDRSHSENPIPSRLGPAFGDDDDADSSYHGAAGVAGSQTGHRPHIQFSDSEPHLARTRRDTISPVSSPTKSLPPILPPHSGTRRQFSFTNMFSRNRSPTPSSPDGPAPRTPISRSALSFNRKLTGGAAAADGTTEEERMGLVKGDTRARSESPPEYDSGSPADETIPPAEELPPGYSGGTVVVRRRREGDDGGDDAAAGGAAGKEMAAG